MNASDCSRCENFVQSTRTLLGMVSKEEEVGLGTIADVYETTFAPILRREFGDSFESKKLSALAERNGEHSRRRVVNVILEVMRYCQANPVECGWNYFNEYDYDAPFKSRDVVNERQGLNLMKHENFWTLVEYGCQVKCKKGAHTHYPGTLCTPNLACRSMEQCISRFVNPDVLPIPTREKSYCAERANGVISEDSPFHEIEISAAVRSIQNSVMSQIEAEELNEAFGSIEDVTLDMMREVKNLYPSDEDTMRALVNNFVDKTAHHFERGFWKRFNIRESGEYCENFSRLAAAMSVEGTTPSLSVYACSICNLGAYTDTEAWPYVSPLDDRESDICYGSRLNEERFKEFLMPYGDDLELDGPVRGDYTQSVLETIMKKTAECARGIKDRHEGSSITAELLHNLWIQESFVYFQTMADYHRNVHAVLTCDYVKYEVRNAMSGFFGSPAMKSEVNIEVSEKMQFRAKRICRDIRCCPSKLAYTQVESKASPSLSEGLDPRRIRVERTDLLSVDGTCSNLRGVDEVKAHGGGGSGSKEPESDKEEQVRFTFDVRDALKGASSPSEVLSVIAQFGSEGDVQSPRDDSEIENFFDVDGESDGSSIGSDDGHAALIRRSMSEEEDRSPKLDLKAELDSVMRFKNHHENGRLHRSKKLDRKKRARRRRRASLGKPEEVISEDFT